MTNPTTIGHPRADHTSPHGETSAPALGCFRQYKILTIYGRFIKKHHPPKSNYHKSYQSSSFWLSPNTLRGRFLIPVPNHINKRGYIGRGPGYPIRDHCFLSAELLLDFDRIKYNRETKQYIEHTWEQVQQDVIRALDFFADKPYIIRRIQFSGSHGFHIILEDLEGYFEEMPDKRLEEFRRRREALKQALIPLELQTLDIELILDPYRVYKVPDSYDRSSGYKVQEISQEAIRSTPISQLLGSISRDAMTANSPHDIGEGRRARISLPPITVELFVTNQVHGVKDGYVLAMVVPRLQLDLLKRLQKQYKIGTVHIFLREGKFIVMSTKVFSLSRAVKIYRAFGAWNLMTFLNLGHSKVFLDAMYLGDITATTIGQHSRPHVYFLKQIGAEVPITNLIGITKFKNAIQITRGHH